MRFIFCFLTALCLMASSAWADEVWSTDQGDMIYWDDVGDIAVWGDSDKSIRFYLPGLPSSLDNRSHIEGFWIGPFEEYCKAPAIMKGPDGYEGGAWGKIIVVFHQTTFPSSWTMTMTDCFENNTRFLIGTPITG